MFDKDVAQATVRLGRDQKGAIEIVFKDGSKIDIKETRVKEWISNKPPKAPAGSLDKIKCLPGSKGYKRAPTPEEIEFIQSLLNKYTR